LNKPAGISSGVWLFIKREPLVHFLVTAILLFVASAVFSGDDREVITVEVAAQEYLVQQRQDLMLRPLTDEEKAEAVEDFIEEEILIREGRKRGFENSSRIRSLLLQNMRFFMTNEIPDPTEEDLRAFFDENPERIGTKPSITYEHVMFSNPDAVPDNTLDVLRAGADYRSTGDTNTFNAKLPNVGEQEIVVAYGREQAPVILGIDDDQWHGPFMSPVGVHFLRVSERHPGMRPTYEAARKWLEDEWLMEKRREVLERELAVMRKNYRIEVMQQGPEAE